MKFIFVCLLMLAGCASSTIPLGSDAPTPYQWQQYCAEHSDRGECK